MPLRDHFQPPWSERNLWEGFHSAWVNTMVRDLNGSVLPPGFRAFPQVHLGPFVETDLATFEEEGPPPDAATGPGGQSGNGPAAWAPPTAVQTLEVEFPAQDAFEVRVYDDQRNTRLVAVVELVSPANKDRAEHRQAFVARCAAYLQEQVALVVVDIVSNRHANLHRELLALFAPAQGTTALPDLYAGSYRSRKEKGKWRLDTWPVALAVDGTLPSMPLWLTSRRPVPLDLEKTYEETCRVLRIG